MKNTEKRSLYMDISRVKKSLFLVEVLMSALLLQLPVNAEENVEPPMPGMRFVAPSDETHGIPIRTQDNVFLDNPHCPSAKLDIWFSQGAVSSMLFVPGVKNDPVQRAMQTSRNGVNTYVIGPRDCMFRVTVEPVRNDDRSIDKDR